ncbi:hypothetical protein ACFQ2T_08070 [Methylophilus flavus]|uniref:Integrase n=1 Tax=Methylophilus flavus TaxID=640084 RepID=A0ABW3PCX3_9PROT
MSVVFEPQLDYPVGAICPDIYESSPGTPPPDDFVVSRSRDGSVVSTYGQMAWDLSIYHPEGKSNILNFCYWDSGEENPTRKQLTYEIRFLIFLLIWARDGAPLSLGTLQNYLSILRALAKFAEDMSRQIREILIDDKHLWLFIETRCSGWAIETFGSLLPLLVRLGNERLGFDIVGDKQLKAIRSLGQQYRTTLKQHAPIPTRIYSQIIAQLLKELAEWEEVSDDVLSVLQACGTDPRMGRSVEVQAAISKRKGLGKNLLPTFSQLASTKCLNYFDIKSREPAVKDLSALISEIQTAIKLTIQTFTGMRDDEALSLPYHCLEETVVNGKSHYIVLGRTTKLNNGKAKRTRWVTNQDSYRAIKLAQQIADTIFGVFGVTAKKTAARIADHPLFVSVSYLGLAGGKPKLKGDQFSIGFIYLERMSSLRKRLEPIIEDADIRELEHIDPHRAWRSEDRFQIGKPWLFTSHQLRRSLALYAQRSGYVSLPSLRRQLQHLTIEMSRYYAKGSASAKNFIGEDKDHFGLEWQRAQPESAALSYVLNVLLSNDILFGGHANWVEHILKDSKGVILVDRETTLRRFKKGEISYKETPFGGCTKVGECEQPALNWLHVDCLKSNCRNLVGNLTKLERVIAAQDKMVKALDQGTIEYRIEKADLEVLVATREAVLKTQ